MGKAENLSWIGCLSIVSGLLLFFNAFFSTIMPFDYGSQGYFIFSLLNLIGSMMVLFSIIGIDLVHRSTNISFNKFSFILGMFGVSFMIGASWFFTFAAPYLYLNAPKLINGDLGPPLGDWMFISFLIFAISMIFIGIQIIKGKSIPFIIGIGFILSPIIDVLLHKTSLRLADMLFSLTIIYLGVSFYRKGKISS